MAKIWVEAYGCSASFADSEMISGLIVNGGHTLAEDPSETDLNPKFHPKLLFNLVLSVPLQYSQVSLSLVLSLVISFSVLVKIPDTSCSIKLQTGFFTKFPVTTGLVSIPLVYNWLITWSLFPDKLPSKIQLKPYQEES